jgi:hypothetical protein
MLILPVALASFESIAGRDPQIGEFLGGIEHPQLAQGSLAQFRRPLLDPLPRSEAFSVAVAVAADHRPR